MTHRGPAPNEMVAREITWARKYTCCPHRGTSRGLGFTFQSNFVLITAMHVHSIAKSPYFDQINKEKDKKEKLKGPFFSRNLSK